MTILLVEDEVSWIDLVFEVASESDVRVDCVGSASRAMSRLTKGVRYSGLVVDVGLIPSARVIPELLALSNLTPRASLLWSASPRASGMMGDGSDLDFVSKHDPLCEERLRRYFEQFAPLSGRTLDEPTTGETLLRRIRNLKAESLPSDGTELENLVASMLEECGHFDRVQTRVRTSTGEIDVVCSRQSRHALFKPEILVFECKDRRSTVSSATVRSLQSKVLECEGACGIIVSRSRPSTDAVLLSSTLVKAAPSCPIVFLDLDSLEDSLTGASLPLVSLIQDKMLDLRLS